MTKATTFNSEKALAYLKENGQRNFSIIRNDYAKSVRVMLIWHYIKVEKLGKTAKNFGLPGSNTKTTTSPKPHLFGVNVFSIGATTNVAPCRSATWSTTTNDPYKLAGRCAVVTQ